jgi:hypothetical protein
VRPWETDPLSTGGSSHRFAKHDRDRVHEAGRKDPLRPSLCWVSWILCSRQVLCFLMWVAKTNREDMVVVGSYMAALEMVLGSKRLSGLVGALNEGHHQMAREDRTIEVPQKYSFLLSISSFWTRISL